MNRDIEADLAIDPNNLAEEWLRHPALFYHYSKGYAEAKKKASIYGERVKVIRSQLLKKARGDPKKHLKTAKPNAGDLEAYYRDHEDHKEAKEKLIEAEYQRDLYESIIYAFIHRREALEGMVELYKLKWFAGPFEPQELREGKRLISDKARADLNEQQFKRGR